MRAFAAAFTFLFGVGGEGLLLIGQAHSVRAIRQVPQAVAAGRLFMHLIIWGLGVFVHVSFSRFDWLLLSSFFICLGSIFVGVALCPASSGLLTRRFLF